MHNNLPKNKPMPIDMKPIVGGMTKKQKIVISIVIALVVAALGFLAVATLQIKERADKGEGYVTSIAPNAPGLRGEKGDKGDSPSPAEIRQAVVDYCAASGVCDGKSPSQAVVFAAVMDYCATGKCQGEAGRDGKDATPISDAQIRAHVDAYCANGNCKGEPGDDGTDGTNGIPGKDGRDTTMNCVIRTLNNQPVRYVAWKYVDEADSTYHDIYKLPVWAECVNPVDLRSV